MNGLVRAHFRTLRREMWETDGRAGLIDQVARIAIGDEPYQDLAREWAVRAFDEAILEHRRHAAFAVSHLDLLKGILE